MFAKFFSQMIKPEVSAYAHVSKNRYETLQDHSLLCLKIAKDRNTDTLLKLAAELGMDYTHFDYLVSSAILTHDAGKITPYFQSLKMKAVTIPGRFDFALANHSQLSATYYLDQALDYLRKSKLDIQEQSNYLLLTLVLTQCIAKHHSHLKNLEDFCEEFDEYLVGLKELSETTQLFDYFQYIPKLIHLNHFIIKKFKKCLDSVSEEFIETLYSSTLLLFSILTSSDVLATKQFMQNFVLIDDSYNEELAHALELSYEQSPLNQAIIKYKQEPQAISEINTIRCKFIVNMDKHLKRITENDHLFYLEGLVGIGKTHAAQRFSTEMVQRGAKKVYWSVPYLAIANQVDISNQMLDKQAVRLDSSTMIRVEYTDNEIDYSKMVVNDQLMNYRQATFTFVRLFNLLFSHSKRNALKRLALRDSVIILDELQSIDSLLLTQFFSQITTISKLLNVKILFMSATLPELPQTITLSDAALFRQEKLLTQRNQLNFDFYSIKTTHQEVLTSIDYHQKRILVQCVTKARATEVYESLFQKYPNVYLYTGDTDKEAKNKIIEQLKHKNPQGNYTTDQIIVVTTNAIEAGVDISMNVAIVDLTSLDSLEQLSGRVNRNNEFQSEDSIIYVINNERADFMSPIKVNYTNALGIEKIMDIFKEKDYRPFMTEVENQANRSRQQVEKTEAVRQLQFKTVSQLMKLITTDSCYYYHIKDSESKQLKERYYHYHEQRKLQPERYDEFYIKQKEILIALQVYRHEIKDRQFKEPFISLYGQKELLPVYESLHTFEEDYTIN